MEPILITSLLKTGYDLIDRYFTSDEERSQAKIELQKLADQKDLVKLQGHLDILKTQVEGHLKLNLEDAKSASFWNSGWRPAVGWVGVLAMALSFIPKALVVTYIWLMQANSILDSWDGKSNLVIPNFPDLGATDVIGLLVSLLGIGVLRSVDKYNKVETNTTKLPFAK